MSKKTLSAAANKIAMIQRVGKGGTFLDGFSRATATSCPAFHFTIFPTTFPYLHVIIRLPIPKSMNTYRLESRKPFHAELVYKILKEIVKRECRGIVYDPVKCSELVTSLSAKIRNKIKLLEFERYRLVVIVEMGEKKLQGLQLVAKCLWDASRDNFATYTYQNTTVFVSATCFGIYQD